jgi:hypothetical protein
MAKPKDSKSEGERTYVIPSTSFHFGRPAESYLVYDNHRKMLSELFENSAKYYCAEDIKQDLMALAAPIAPCSTYDETSRVAFAMIQQCKTLKEFQEFLEGWLSHPNAAMPGSLIVPALPKSEAGRNLLQPATELSRGCYALCAVAVAALVCLAASCVVGYVARDLHPARFKLPDYARKDAFGAGAADRIPVKNLRVK